MLLFCYLAVPLPTLGHYEGDSLTHSMLISEFTQFQPKGHWLSTSWGLNQEPSNSTTAPSVNISKYLLICLLVDSNPSSERAPRVKPLLKAISLVEWPWSPCKVWFFWAQGNFSAIRRSASRHFSWNNRMLTIFFNETTLRIVLIKQWSCNKSSIYFIPTQHFKALITYLKKLISWLSFFDDPPLAPPLHKTSGTRPVLSFIILNTQSFPLQICSPKIVLISLQTKNSELRQYINFKNQVVTMMYEQVIVMQCWLVVVDFFVRTFLVSKSPGSTWYVYIFVN